MKEKLGKYEENYSLLERITESLNKDEVGIDDLVIKTREALDAARACMEILNKQKGEFQQLETEFTRLLKGAEQQQKEPAHTPEPPAQTQSTPAGDFSGETDGASGDDDPF